MTDWMSFRGFEAMDSHGVIGYKALSLVRDMGIFQNSGQIVDLLPASAIHMSQLPSHTRFSRVLWCISNPSCLPPSLYFFLVYLRLLRLGVYEEPRCPRWLL